MSLNPMSPKWCTQMVKERLSGSRTSAPGTPGVRASRGSQGCSRGSLGALYGSFGGSNLKCSFKQEGSIHIYIYIYVDRYTYTYAVNERLGVRCDCDDLQNSALPESSMPRCEGLTTKSRWCDLRCELLGDLCQRFDGGLFETGPAASAEVAGT